MVTENSLASRSDVGSFTVRGSQMKLNKRRSLKDYKRLTLACGVHGVPAAEVMLFDPTNENDDLLAVDEHMELGLDLKEAFDSFTIPQQRILFRVLVQGLTLEQATKKSRIALRTWQRWYREEALPKLRDLLADYRGETKEVYRDAIPVSGQSIKLTDDPNKITKCRFKPCEYSVRDYAENGLKKMRKHVSKEHPEEFKKIQAHVRSNDREISRLESELPR